MTFLFYDLETTGTDPVFDQVCQFAAIRTDHSLNEIERFERFIRLRPDVIPSAAALVKTQRSISDILRGELEYEVMRDIHRLVNTPGTISIGYNSLDFDDDFLRFGFYRNLLPPYDHQWRNGCGRADLLPLVVLYRHFASDLLEWPEGDKGISLRLEDLSSANRCADGRAHNAMADVRACLNLARRMHERLNLWQEGMWYFCRQNFATTISKLPILPCIDGSDYRIGVMLRHRFGSAKNYVAPVLFLCRSEPYPNKTYWLQLDRANLREKMVAREWDAVLTSKTDGDQRIVRPPTSPRVSTGMAEIANANLVWLCNEPAYLDNLRDYARAFRWPPVPNVDPDASLYPRGFRSGQEDVECRHFHDSPPEQRSALLQDFSHPIDRTLALRLLARNYDERSGDREYQEYLGRARGDGPCYDHRGCRKRTRKDALAELAQEESPELDDAQRTILTEMRDWIESSAVINTRGAVGISTTSTRGWSMLN